MGYIRANPADRAILPRIERKTLTTLPEERIADFIRAIENDAFRSLYFVTLFTGMRQGEILGLTWDNVDFKRGTIYVFQQLQKNRDTGRYELVPLKNEKPRRLSPAGDILAELAVIKARQAEYRLLAGKGWNNADNLVFTDETGGHLIHNTVYKHFKRIAESLDMPDLRFHDLRHSYAVNSLLAGDDIKTVQDNLGHHTAAFTLDVYGFVSERMKRDSADRMQRFIQSWKA